MELAELQQAVSRGEDSTQQFKEDVRNEDALAAEMTAFANARGGRIFLGVSNRGALTGFSLADVDRINQLISNAANQHVRGPLPVRTENVVVGASRIVVVLMVPEGIDKPYFDRQGVIWLKSGADKRRINSKEELRRLFQEVDLVHADEVLMRAGIEAVDIPLLTAFFQNTYHDVLPTAQADQLRLLENMNLAGSGQLNLAGLLLFGKKPQLYKPECTIKAAWFAGKEASGRYVDSEDFSGPLSTLFRGALAFVMRTLLKVQGQKSVNTVGDPEIPQIVLEELLVNALIHRDYFITAPIRLFVFADRIEILSPGNLPNHLTVQKILAGNSVQRNPILASFAAKGLLPYRGLGTGVRRAIESWPRIRFVDDREGCLFLSIVERPDVPVPDVVARS